MPMPSSVVYLLHQQLEKAAQHSPEAIAVTAKDASVTYGDLHRTSDAIAGALQDHGVRPGDLVGVCMSKTTDAVACWFGVLKAGAAYVPIDIAAPLPRIAGIVSTSAMQVLIVDRPRPELADTVPHVLSAKGLRAKGRPPNSVHGADSDVAYVYFTSGSTGCPKGVVITHRAALSYLASANEILRADSSDCVANNSPLAFDLGSFDVHFAVRTCARLCMIPESATVMPGSLLQFLEEERPTILYSVPTFYNRLAALSSIGDRRFPSLRSIVFAGETPNVSALSRLRPVFSNATFHHWYGSTEAALVTSIAFEPGEPLPQPMPIGSPVPNVSIRLRNGDDLCEVTAGASGELVVSATLLLQGYCRNTVLTDECFMTSPSAGGNVRWFKTRDFVRCSENGDLFYGCRLDRMVKIKGFRVDVGEIEAVLNRSRGIQEAAVVAVPDASVGARLHAFAVAPARTPADIAQELRRTLPSHFVPQTTTLLEALPHGETGKIDYLALGQLANLDSNPIK